MGEKDLNTSHYGVEEYAKTIFCIVQAPFVLILLV